MLDERDLQLIKELLAQQKQEILTETTQAMNVLIETKVQTQLNILAEGQQAIMEKLVPRSRVDDLEEEIKFLKVIVRKMNEEIQQLKQA